MNVRALCNVRTESIQTGCIRSDASEGPGHRFWHGHRKSQSCLMDLLTRILGKFFQFANCWLWGWNRDHSWGYLLSETKFRTVLFIISIWISWRFSVRPSEWISLYGRIRVLTRIFGIHLPTLSPKCVDWFSPNIHNKQKSYLKFNPMLLFFVVSLCSDDSPRIVNGRMMSIGRCAKQSNWKWSAIMVIYRKVKPLHAQHHRHQFALMQRQVSRPMWLYLPPSPSPPPLPLT